jgi:hypothetical protein
MQYWIDRSGIAQRPMPKLGLTAEEVADAAKFSSTFLCFGCFILPGWVS